MKKLLLAALFVLLAAPVANAYTIDFEGITTGTTTERNRTRVFGDFSLFVVHGHYQDSSIVRPHGNSSDTFLNDDTRPSVLTKTDGSAFSLISLDVAEWIKSAGNILEVRATLVGGGSKAVNLRTDISPAFQTFDFTGWDNLLSLSLRNRFGRFAYDNIVLDRASNEIPEPATALLLAMGGLAALRRKSA